MHDILFFVITPIVRLMHDTFACAGNTKLCGGTFPARSLKFMRHWCRPQQLVLEFSLPIATNFTSRVS
jgi:hypothetical protein